MSYQKRSFREIIVAKSNGGGFPELVIYLFLAYFGMLIIKIFEILTWLWHYIDFLSKV